MPAQHKIKTHYQIASFMKMCGDGYQIKGRCPVVPYHKRKELHALAISLIEAIETENTLLINYFKCQDEGVQKKALKIARKHMNTNDLEDILHGYS